MNETKTHALRGILCTTIGGICWGFSGTCGQYLFMHWDVAPLFLTCMRLLFSGLILVPLAFFREREKTLLLLREPHDLLRLLIFGLAGLALCQYSYMTAISHSNAAATTVLQSLNLVFIMLITCLRLRRRPRRLEVVALILAFGGTYILATGGNPYQMTLSPQGLFWGLMTAAALTLYTLLPQKLLKKWGRELVTGCGMLFGGVILNLAARSWTLVPVLPAKGWVAVAAIVILGSVVAFTLFMQGIADLGPVKSSMLTATEPVAAAIFSALWLKTAFSAADIIGFMAIIATIFLLSKDG